MPVLREGGTTEREGGREGGEGAVAVTFKSGKGFMGLVRPTTTTTTTTPRIWRGRERMSNVDGQCRNSYKNFSWRREIRSLQSDVPKYVGPKS